MKSRYVSLRKNPAGSPEYKKMSYPGKGMRFGKHLFITYVKIEYTLCSMLPSLLDCSPDCVNDFFLLKANTASYWTRQLDR